jgi:Na+/H+-dicarboxylate symporter
LESARSRPWLLPALMLAGAACGLAIGGVLGPRWKDPELALAVLPLRLVGTIFLSLLKALIIPLVVASVVASVANLGDLHRLGRVAALTASFFLGTTLLAVLTGVGVVNAIRPGAGLAGAPVAELSETVARAGQSPVEALYDVITGMFPPNLVAAAAEGNILGLIVASLLFGTALSLLGPRGSRLGELAEISTAALLKLVHWVVWLAPLGILGLVAERVGNAGGGEAIWADLKALGWYAASVLTGLALHAFVTLPLLLLVLARRNPLRFLAGMGDSLLTAFGTASSAATLGVTLACLQQKNGISARAADFVVPLGTTVNMNGTALYEAVAVLFIAQTLGVELGTGSQLVVVLTATLAAIGAAAIPEAGLVTMLLVLTAVGLPPEGIGLILSIDWILDRFRTAVNVWGDAVGAAVVDRRLASPVGEGRLK